MSSYKHLSQAALLVCASFFASYTYAAEEAQSCGEIQIADATWASGEFSAALDKFILENAFGCDVTIVSGDVLATIASMVNKGQPDVVPEMYVSSAREVLDEAFKEGSLVKASRITPEATEGWWISKAIHEKYPDIKTVRDVLKRPELFPHPEEEGKAAFMNCPAGWACQHVGNNLSKAYGFKEAGFEIIDPGSSAGLDGAIAKAHDREEAWFGFYWTPSSVVGKYGLHRLEMDDVYDDEHWNNCIVKEECESPKVSRWSETENYTVVTKKFAESAPKAVMEYFEKRQYPNDMSNNLLVWMADEQANGEDAVEYFLKKHEDLWSQWLSEDNVKLIKSKL